MDVTFVTIVESSPRGQRQLTDLALALRTFGGALADAPLVAFVTGRNIASVDVALGPIELRPLPPPDPAHPRLRRLDAVASLAESAGTLVLLEADALVVGDLTAHVGNTVAAVHKDDRPMPDIDWRRLYWTFGVRPPDPGPISVMNGLPSRPLLDTGVLVLPPSRRDALVASWTAIATELVRLSNRYALDFLAPPRWFDRFALMIALYRDDVRFEYLPLGCDFELSFDYHPSVLPSADDLRVIRYGPHMDDRGAVLSSRLYPWVDPVIDRFDRVLAEYLGHRYRRPPRRAIGSELRGAIGASALYRSTAGQRVRAAVRNVRSRGSRG